LAFFGFLFGLMTSNTWYLASAQLIRNDGASGFRDAELGETFRSQPLSDTAFRELLHSRELADRVSEKSFRQISTKGLAGKLQLSPEQNIEFITVTLARTDPQSAVNLVNLFASEAAQMTKEIQAAEAKGAIEHLQRDLKETERKHLAVQENLLALSQNLPRSAASTANIRQDLRTAQKELVNLLAKYTTNHPQVKEQYAKIDVLEKQLKEVTASGNAITTNTRLEDFEKVQEAWQKRLREAEHFAHDPPGYYRVFTAAKKDDVVSHSPKLKILVLTLCGGFAGLCFAIVAAFLVEISDRRTRTRDDVQRVTGLSVLSTLVDLSRMSREKLGDWVFRTWTIFKGKTRSSPDRGVVCGFTSSDHGGRRSTGVKFLGEAAGRFGQRVLTITTRRTPPHGKSGPEKSTSDPVSPGAKRNGVPANAASSSNSASTIHLRPDDFACVPSAPAKEVFVLGAVLQPKSVFYREHISLLGAIANAEGTSKDAYLSHVAVMRGSLSDPKLAIVDYHEIVSDKAPDVSLEPGDIVYVPFTPYLTLARYADLILRTFVERFATNEDSPAVSDQAGAVGMSIDVGGASPASP
jgi:capsular polysaccharide biosynthesis protein